MTEPTRGGRGTEGLNAPVNAGSARAMLTADRSEVRVPNGEDGDIIVDVRERRPDVVARLLRLGLSPRTLITLLPEWEELILDVASEGITVR